MRRCPLKADLPHHDNTFTNRLIHTAMNTALIQVAKLGATATLVMTVFHSRQSCRRYCLSFCTLRPISMTHEPLVSSEEQKSWSSQEVESESARTAQCSVIELKCKFAMNNCQRFERNIRNIYIQGKQWSQEKEAQLQRIAVGKQPKAGERKIHSAEPSRAIAQQFTQGWELANQAYFQTLTGTCTPAKQLFIQTVQTNLLLYQTTHHLDLHDKSSNSCARASIHSIHSALCRLLLATC